MGRPTTPTSMRRARQVLGRLHLAAKAAAEAATAQETAAAALPVQQLHLLPGICSLPRQAGALPWCTGSGAVPAGHAHARHGGAAASACDGSGTGPWPARLYTPGTEVAHGGCGGLPLAGLAVGAQAAQTGSLRAGSPEKGPASGAAAEAPALELCDAERQAVVGRLQQKLLERGLAVPDADAGQQVRARAKALHAGPGEAAAAARKLCGYMKAAVRSGNAMGAAQLFEPALLLQVRMCRVTSIYTVKQQAPCKGKITALLWAQG